MVGSVPASNMGIARCYFLQGNKIPKEVHNIKLNSISYNVTAVEYGQIQQILKRLLSD